MSNLDIARFRKVHALMIGGATDGEKAAARVRATVMAKKAGMTLLEAVAASERPTVQVAKPASSMFEEFFNSPEFKAERAEREAKKAVKRAALLVEYGSEEAVWSETAEEALLSAAVDHLKEWKDFVNPATGEKSRYVEKIAGWRAFFGNDEMPDTVRLAVSSAYPMPEDLRGLLDEYLSWDKIYLDRNAFDSFDHWHWVAARLKVVQLALETRPVQNWQDMAARMNWWQTVLDWQQSMPIEYDQAFKDRVVADLEFLRSTTSAAGSKDIVADELDVNKRQHRTNADKASDVRQMLESEPNLADREIARRVGVSPQTVSNWRERLGARFHRRAA